MLGNLRRRVIVFNIILLLLFLSIVINSGVENIHIHIPFLAGVFILSLLFIILNKDGELEV